MLDQGKKLTQFSWKTEKGMRSPRSIIMVSEIKCKIVQNQN